MFLLLSGCGKNSEAPEFDKRGHQSEATSANEHGIESESLSEDKVTLSDKAIEIAGIETTVVRMEPFQQTIQVPGSVSSTDKGKAVVTPPVAGRVVSISASLGDTVKQGQVLAIVESSELSQAWSTIADATRLRDAAKSEVEQARSEVQLSQAKLSASRTNLTRQRQLVEAGAFSQAPVQQAQNELNDAQSELLSIQKEQASHADVVRRLENLFRDGIVSKAELEAARLELQQDQIRLDRTKARIEVAKATYEREKNIASRGLLNAKELQAAEAEVKSSELELERARIRVRAADSALANANRAIKNSQVVYRAVSGSGGASGGRVSLVAPISGVITHFDITRGQAVDRIQVLLEIENLRSVWVTANVPESEIERVRKGATATLSLASLPNREFKGVIQVVGTRVDPKTRSIPVQCLVTQSNGLLKPEMFAKVFIGIGKPAHQLVIPKSALVIEGDKTFVFVKNTDAFEKQEIVIGDQSNSLAVVLSGIEEGVTIASKGAFILASELKKNELKGHEH